MPSSEEVIKSNLKGDIDSFLSRKKAEKNEDQHNIKFLNILEFVDKFQLLPYGLYPVQKFLLKVFYDIPLDTELPPESQDRIRVPKNWKNVADYVEMTEIEYLEYLYSEGRCNVNKQGKVRKELILVMGRRSGKCVREGTLIPTSRGLRRIEEFGDKDGSEWQDLSLEISKEDGSRSFTDGFYNPGFQDTITIGTYFGYELCGTTSHRVKVINNDGNIVWKELKDIHIGDYVGINKNSNLWSCDYLDVSQFHQKSSMRELNLPNILDERHGKLLGILVGDGSWTYEEQINITGECPDFLDYCKSLLNELFNHHSEKRKQTNGDVWSLHVYSRPLRRFLNSIGYTTGCVPSQKHVPWSIFQSPKSVVSAFISGLFEADGGCEKDGSTISFVSASKQLSSEVQQLLLNFGIVSNLSPKYNKKYKRYYWRVSIVGYDSRVRFRDEIGFITKTKNCKLENGIKNGGEGHSSTNSIPHLKAKLRSLIQSVPKSTNNKLGIEAQRRTKLKNLIGGAAKPSSRENISYERLQRVVDLSRDLGADSVISQDLQNLINLNYCWVKVTDKVLGRHRVYDLSVPDGHEYVAGGFTNHNSTMSAIISAYELYKLLRRGHPQSYYGMPDGSEIRILCIANDQEQAQIVYQEMSGYIGQVDYFKNNMIHDTMKYMKFQTENDKKIFGEATLGKQGGKGTITATFKSSIAKGLRGRGVICCIMDEIAFFEEDGKSGANQIYRALTPALKQFSPKDPKKKIIPLGPSEGRMILISSPDAKDGFLYRQYQMSKSGDKSAANMLMLQAPTWEVNPTLSPEDYEEEYAKDPSSFETEFGAQFSDRVRGWIENSEDLTSCIDPELRPHIHGLPREPFFAGVDFGLVGDGTSISLTHLKDGKIELAYHEVWYAGVPWKESNPHLVAPAVDYANCLQDQQRLDIEEIAKWFEALNKRFFILNGVFDQYAGAIFEQHLHKKKLTQFEMRKFSTADSSNMYRTLKMAMYDALVSIYDWPLPKGPSNIESTKKEHCPFITELLELQATAVGKNLLQVEAPKIAGKHDDVSDSYARSVLLATEYISENPGILETTFSKRANSLMSNKRRIGYKQFHRTRSRMHGGIPKERRINKR